MEKLAVTPALGKAERKKPPKQLAIIDQKGCTGCHACVPLCPVDCIENVPGEEHPDFMRVVEVDLERCIGCTICAQYCPWETIFMVPHDEGEQKAKDWTLRTVLYQDLADAGTPIGPGAVAHPPAAAEAPVAEVPPVDEPQDK